MLDSAKDILTVNDVKDILGTSRNTIYKLLHKGKIKYLYVGTSIKIPKVYLIEFIENNCKTDD